MGVHYSRAAINTDGRLKLLIHVEPPLRPEFTIPQVLGPPQRGNKPRPEERTDTQVCRDLHRLGVRLKYMVRTVGAVTDTPLSAEQGHRGRRRAVIGSSVHSCDAQWGACPMVSNLPKVRCRGDESRSDLNEPILRPQSVETEIPRIIIVKESIILYSTLTHPHLTRGL